MLKWRKLIRDADVVVQNRLTGKLKQLSRPCGYKQASDLPLLRESTLNQLIKPGIDLDALTGSFLYIYNKWLTRY